MSKKLSILTFARQSLTRLVAVAAIGAGLVLTQTAGASAQNPKYAGFVIDANNGHVLYNDRGDEFRYPASLTKMMTLYLTFDALNRGKISLDDDMPVSSYAASRPPSKLGMRPGSTLKVEEAIGSLVTKSANDAAVVLAEYVGGSEDDFAKLMTAKAHQLGMSRTEFRNANGLPNPEQHTTARDMTTLGIALREHFPQYYHFFSIRSYSFRGRRLGNHDRVLFRYDGADGIKTGYINASGFNLVTSVKKDGKSVVAAVFGGRSGRSRDDHMIELLKRYMPDASTSDTGPLVASLSSADLSSPLPKHGPVPDRRPMAPVTPKQQEIESRIALAYGSDTAASVAVRMPEPERRPLVGRAALAAALVEERPVPQFQMPAASRPVPPAPIPSAPAIDTGVTGSVARTESRPSSPWVVQIAAAPDRKQALDLLAAAKAKVGGPLSETEPFTEAVTSGSQTLYRARFAGFSSKDQAWNACAALKRSSYSCYAVAN